jgi:hypothetical protein
MSTLGAGRMEITTSPDARIATNYEAMFNCQRSQCRFDQCRFDASKQQAGRLG